MHSEQCAYGSVAEVNLVANDNEWKVFSITWTRLDEKLVTPALQGLERVGNGDIVDQNAAVGAAVECYTQTLKPFLARRVPDLRKVHYCHL